jgi:hypothetical protein
VRKSATRLSVGPSARFTANTRSAPRPKGHAGSTPGLCCAPSAWCWAGASAARPDPIPSSTGRADSRCIRWRCYRPRREKRCVMTPRLLEYQPAICPRLTDLEPGWASEHSPGSSVRRGGITRAGNVLARRVLIEGAWACRIPARVSRKLHDCNESRRPRSSTGPQWICSLLSRAARYSSTIPPKPHFVGCAG